jgi:hypothetical protein
MVADVAATLILLPDVENVTVVDGITPENALLIAVSKLAIVV